MNTESIEVVASRTAEAQFAAADLDLETRARGLDAIADALDSRKVSLVALAQRETGLGQIRLEQELRRTTGQLRIFAGHVRDGGFLEVQIDERDDNYFPSTRPDIRRYLAPLGPALNFAASNFPFAFSVAGGDTASALAAGCSVVVKVHQGHPELSELTASITRMALADAGSPPDLVQIVVGRERGVELLKRPEIAVGTFTGSFEAGTLLARIASQRTTPIPFYGELGSINPVFVLPTALAAGESDIVAGLVASVTGSAGQLCTKPGLIFIPVGSNVPDTVAAAASVVPEHRFLYPALGYKYVQNRDAVLAQPGVSVVTEGSTYQDDAGSVWGTPTIARVSLSDFERNKSELAREVFGPFALLVEYDDADQLEVAAEQLPGTLTATIHAGEADAASRLLRHLAHISGRVVFGGWPTGVSVTSAMQHGGPWPATTNAQHTSVGAAAIRRFLVPVAYQGFHSDLLPPPLRDENPWHIPQRRATAHAEAER